FVFFVSAYSGSVRFDFQPSRDLHPSPTLTSGSVWTSHLTMAQDIQYDPAIIQKFANALYKRARSIVAVMTLLGVLVGGVVGFGMGHESDSALPFVLGGMFLAGFIGYLVGQARVFALKLQAQIALCQMHIESNTRTSR
ncbi:MAG: hypothetical protein ACI8UO_004252, partial [Verrucomicrobiales bacterium]